MAFRDDILVALSKQMEPEKAEALVKAFEEHIYSIASKGASEGATKVVKPIYYAVGVLGAINLIRFLRTPRQLKGRHA